MNKRLQMTSGVGSDRFTNLATTTAHNKNSYYNYQSTL